MLGTIVKTMEFCFEERGIGKTGLAEVEELEEALWGKELRARRDLN